MPPAPWPAASLGQHRLLVTAGEAGLAIHGASAAGVQRARHPETCSFGEWITVLGELPRVRQGDRYAGRGGREVAVPPAVDVIGRPADERAGIGNPAGPVPRIREVLGDVGVLHPSLGWVVANLPPQLVATVYMLPADCADTALILRHVWLSAHRTTERHVVNGRTVLLGSTTGSAEVERTERNATLVNSTNFAQLLTSVQSDGRRPLRSAADVIPRLAPGDVLVWRHADGTGHVQTFLRRVLPTGQPRRIEVLAGNQPLPSESGDRLRWAPGRRVEVQYIEEPDLRDRGGVWQRGDSALVVAGRW